jgi:hypothetical protein
MILVVVICGTTLIFWHTEYGMILEEAPESAKQLCTLKLKISYVSRKGGIWDFECAPILAAFMADLISTLYSAFASTGFRNVVGYNNGLLLRVIRIESVKNQITLLR